MIAIFLAVALIILSLLSSCSLDLSPPTGPLGGGLSYDKNNNNCGSARGAPIWYVDFNNLNLVVKDIPIWVDSAYGPTLSFALTYNILGQRSEDSPVGSRWTHQYTDYITKHKESGSLVLFSDNGRVDEYSNVGVNYILNKQTVMSGEAAVLPRLVIDGEVINAIYPNGAYKRFNKVEVKEEEEEEVLYQLAEIADKSGNTINIEYQQDKLYRISNSQEQSLTVSYNKAGKIVAVTGPTDYQAQFSYNKKGELISLTDMQGYTATVGYDDEGYIRYLTDAKGTTQFIAELGDPESTRVDEYPAFGDPMGMSSRMTVIDPRGYKQEYFYNTKTGKSWFIGPENYIDYIDRNTNNGQEGVPKTVYSYERYSKGYSRINKIEYPDDSWVSYGYDRNRNVEKVIYSNGDNEHYRNNSLGEVIQSIDALSNDTFYVYDDNRNLIKIRSPLGEYFFSYDKNHRLKGIVDLSGNKYHYEYNSRGQLSTALLPDSTDATYHYNDIGLLALVTVGDKPLERYEYDLLNRVTSIENLWGQKTQYQYDNINQITNVSKDGGRDYQVGYGSCPGLVDSETSPGGRTYQYQYNSAKQLVGMIDPMQGQTQLVRDATGRLKTLIDTNQNQTEFEYDNSGQLKTKRYSDGSELNYEYEQGYVKKRINARGIEKLFRYNLFNQLVAIEYSDTTRGLFFNYDEFGRIKNIQDGIGDTQFVYAKDGVFKEVDGPLPDDTINFEYDSLQRLASLSVNGEDHGQYEYDVLSRLTQIQAFGEVFNIMYDDTPKAAGAKIIRPNGLIQQVKMDELGDLSSLTYTLDDTIVSQTDYGFDLDGKLVELRNTESLPFDPELPISVFNHLNQMTSLGDELFKYDADGNLITGLLPGGFPFEAEYDAENRLKSLSFNKEGKAVEERFEYGYDNFLRRYQRFDDGALAKTKQFVRTGLLELQDRNANNDVVAKNAWRPSAAGGIGGLLVREQDGQKLYYQANHLGHVQGVYDAQGQRLSLHAYSPYGTVTGDDFSLQPYGMSTKRSDFSSGLVYFGYRFYSPYQRRWLNRDPLQEQGGINLYGYVNGDPLGYVDPDGRNPLLFGAIVGTVVEGYNQYQSGNFNGGQLLVSAATGAIGGLGSSAIKSLVAGGLAGAANSAYKEFDNMSNCNSIDFGKIYHGALYGAEGGIIGYGVGNIGKNIYKAPTNIKVFNPNTKLNFNYGAEGTAIGSIGGGIIGNQ